MSKSSKTTDNQGWPRHDYLRTTHAFRMLNFELYAKPNKIIMGAGVACLASAIAYIIYMRSEYSKKGNHSVLLDDRNEVTTKKISKWDT